MKYIYIGQFDQISKKLIAADPFCEINDKYNSKIIFKNVKRGKYNVWTVLNENDIRCNRLVIKYCDPKTDSKKYNDSNCEWVYKGNFGILLGRYGIYDKKIFRDEKNIDYDPTMINKYEGVNGYGLNNDNNWVNLNFIGERANIIPNGTVASVGEYYGYATGNVYCIYSKNTSKVIGITVVTHYIDNNVYLGCFRSKTSKLIIKNTHKNENSLIIKNVKKDRWNVYMTIDAESHFTARIVCRQITAIYGNKNVQYDNDDIPEYVGENFDENFVRNFMENHLWETVGIIHIKKIKDV